MATVRSDFEGRGQSRGEVSEWPNNRRQGFLKRLKYTLGEERWLHLLEMAEAGELDGQLKRFRETLESDDWEQHLKRYEFKRGFPEAFN
jgi:hypothetical protein